MSFALACRAVANETGTAARNWKSTDGPLTGVGSEYYLVHPRAGTWYVCVDQLDVTSCVKVSEEYDD